MRSPSLIVLLLAGTVCAADDPTPSAPPPAAQAAMPSGFEPARAPLRPADFPHHLDPVNRDRVYDFYAKEALHFMRNPPPADGLLPAYSGLDGGRQGHWGNQNDDVTWRDARWGASEHRPVFSGVLRQGDLVIPKAVWVSESGRNGCFDPLSLSFRARWQGDFLRLTDRRRGFNGAAEVAGSGLVTVPAATLAPGDLYHGFYRSGDQVVFSYRKGGKEYLETLGKGPWLRQPGETPVPGPARWPRWIETVGKLGDGAPFAVDTLTLPFENPYGALFFVSGFDFVSKDAIALCTMTGEVWLVRGIDDSLGKLRWKRFATGLHQPLGLKVVDGRILVIGRDQLTRLVDLNGDDEADFHECVTNAFETSAGAHDYIVGLDIDPKGRLYTASASQGILRLNAPGDVEVVASGLRNPNGLAVSPDGRYVVSQGQEGDWTPASSIFRVDTASKALAPYFGYPGPRGDRETTPPLLYLPRGEDNSSGGGTFIPKWAWPDLATAPGPGELSNMVHLSYGGGSAYLVTESGAATLVTGAFDAGPQHARFSPHDRRLYVSGMAGWGTYTPADGCLQRVRRTGRAPMLVNHWVDDRGISLDFSEPLDPTFAGDVARHFVQAWNYRYSPAYGSPEYSVAQPGKVGHDRWRVEKASVGGPDNRTLRLSLPDIRKADQVHLHVTLSPGLTRDIFLSIHRPPSGLGIAGGDHAAHAVAAQSAGAPAVRPVRWESELCGDTPRRIELRTATGLQYAQRELRAKPGEYLAIRFENPDTMPHNWVLTKVGAADRVAGLADRMVADPDALDRSYVPDSDDILCHSRLLMPGTGCTLYLRAPETPGDYPYFCSFPGHSQIMRGVLVIEAAGR